MQELLNDTAIYVRSFNVIAALACLSWYLVVISEGWSKLERNRKNFHRAIVFFLFSAAFGSAEALRQDVEPGFRMFILTGACLMLLKTLWDARHVPVAER